MKIFKYNLSKDFNSFLFPVLINNHDIIKNENLDMPSQYSLEIYFNKIISNSKFIVDDINIADIIYLPIYTFLISWKTRDYFYDVNKIVNYLNEILNVINEINKKYSGKRILFVYSDVMWEDERCFINHINFPENVFILTYEKVIDKFCNNQISVPFITHIRDEPVNYIINNNPYKSHLISYVGRYRKEVEYFSNLTVLSLNKYNTEGQWISFNNKDMYNDIDNLYQNSYYSLQPHGDKETRKGFYHSLLLGCIPVIFENNIKTYESIFKNYLSIEDICIVIKNNKLSNIENILQSKITEIPKMIKSIEKIKHLLLYPDTNELFLQFIIEKMSRPYLLIDLDMWSKCFTLEWYTFFTNVDMYYITPNVKKLNTIKDVLPNNSTIIFVEQNKIDTRNFCKNKNKFKFIYWCDDIHHDLRIYNEKLFQVDIPLISAFGNSLINSYKMNHYAQDLYFTTSFNDNPINKILITGAGYIDDSIYGFRNFIFRKAVTDTRITVLPHHKIYGVEYANETNKYIANVTSTLNKTYHYIFAKVFEITAIGSLLVIEDEIEEDLKDVGFYHKKNCMLINKENCNEVIDYILDPNNRKEIYEIRFNGYQNTKTNHNIRKRIKEFNELVKKIEVDYKNINNQLILKY